jgi:transposase
MSAQSPFMSMREAAQFFCVSESTIRNARGDFAALAHVHVGKRHLILRESAEQVAPRSCGGRSP